MAKKLTTENKIVLAIGWAIMALAIFGWVGVLTHSSK